MTVAQLLQKTVQDNPQIQSARSNLEQASGRRLVFHSVALPDATIGLAGGVQGGHRAGEKPVQPFAFDYGNFAQPLFDLAVPASWQRGDTEIFIAQQQLNITVVEQLHAARIAFYTALYNRELKALLRTQHEQLQQVAASQRSRYQAGLVDRGAMIAAQLQADQLNSPIDAAERAYEGSLLQLGEAIGQHLAADRLELEGALPYPPSDAQLERSAAKADQRPDLQLARLLVRAAGEDQRIMEAAYYPTLTAVISGEYIPVSGVRREQSEGSPRRSDDVISSEIRAGAAYTWRVIDNGKISGAVAKERAAREVNELLLQKMEKDTLRDLARMRNNFRAIAAKIRALQSASSAAEQNVATISQNLEQGIASELEFRLAQDDLLQVKTGLLTLEYDRSLALAEWDRATGRYLNFSAANTKEGQ